MFAKEVRQFDQIEQRRAHLDRSARFRFREFPDVELREWAQTLVATTAIAMGNQAFCAAISTKSAGGHVAALMNAFNLKANF